MIVLCDLNSTARDFLYWLIAATMSKDQLESVAAKRATEELMAKADTKNWHTRLDKRSNLCDLFIHGGRITWSIGKKNSVWLERHYFGRRSRSRNYRYPAAEFGHFT